jgi:transposase
MTLDYDDDYSFDEVTLDLLRDTVPKFGFLVPIIRQKGSEKLIDGRHRLKIWEELGGETSKFQFNVCYVETDSPEECNTIINKCRRPWDNKEDRRPIVQALSGKGHSQRAIARAMGVAQATVGNDLAKSKEGAGEQNCSPAPSALVAVKGIDGKQYAKPAIQEEINEALAMKAEGKTNKAIARKLSRGERTIKGWTAKDKTERNEDRLTPTGVLSDFTKEFIKKESKEFGKRIELLESAVELSKQLDKLWKYVQQKHDKHGRPVARQDIEIASKVMIQNGTLASMAATLGLSSDASYFDTLIAIDALGKKISSCARQAIYLSGQSDTVLP